MTSCGKQADNSQFLIYIFFFHYEKHLDILSNLIENSILMCYFFQGEKSGGRVYKQEII